MQISKLLYSSFLSLTLLSFSGCNLPSPQPRDNEDATSSATFFISEVKGTALAARLEKASNLPKNKTFHFTVCVKDRAHSKPLISHLFRIEEINRELKSDEKGCLNWSEDISFNLLSDPRYLEWKRQIIAIGIHKGTRLVHLAINPWNENDNSEAVVDLEKQTPPKLLTDKSEIQETLQESKSSSRLWVNDIRIQSTEQKFTSEGVTLNFDLMAIPQLELTKITGEKILRPLPQGSFKAKLYLIHSLTEGNKETRLVLAESEIQSPQVRGGSLFIKAPLNLTTIPTRGQLILALDLSAEDEGAKIKNFEGVYMIGEYDQLKGSGFLKLMSTVAESKNFQIKDFINASLTDKLSKSSDAYTKPRIEIAPLEFKFIRVGKENTSEREVIFNIKACIKNGLEQKTTRGYTFNVTGFRQDEKSSAKTARITTDNSSCLNWDESLSFKYYACQKYIKGFIDIENPELAVKQRIEVAVNPWEYSGTLARDLRYVDSQERLLTDCKKENVLPSAMSLRSFSYATLAYNYEIDPQLNLHLKKKIRVRLDAAVSLFSDMSRGRMESAQKLRPGVYLLKMAIVKNRDYYNQKTYVSSAEQLVSTLDGDIKTDIEFETSDLKAMGNRNTLLVELDPVREDKVSVDKNGHVVLKEKVNSLDEVIDSSAGLYNRTFAAGITLNSEKDTEDLAALDMKEANQYLISANLPILDGTRKSLVREYIQFGQKLKTDLLSAQKAQADAAAFATRNTLKHIQVNNPRSYEDLRLSVLSPRGKRTDQHLAAGLNQLAVTGKLSSETAMDLCTYWFKDFIVNSVSKEGIISSAPVLCKINARKPENLFTVEKRLFVKEIGDIKYLRGYSTSITVGNNLTLSNSQTHANNRTKSLSFNMGLSKKFAEIFSIGVGGSYTISQMDSSAVATSNSASVITNLALNMQQSIFQLRFNKYQECAIVKVNPRHFMKYGVFASSLKAHLSEGEKAEVATRGLMICTGVDNQTPILRNENYYLLFQEGMNSALQDSGDARNRNFFMALRGEKEFRRLMYFMKGEIHTPKTADRETEDQKRLFHGLDALINSGHANIPGSFNDSP